MKVFEEIKITTSNHENEQTWDNERFHGVDHFLLLQQRNKWKVEYSFESLDNNLKYLME